MSREYCFSCPVSQLCYKELHVSFYNAQNQQKMNKQISFNLTIFLRTSTIYLNAWHTSAVILVKSVAKAQCQVFGIIFKSSVDRLTECWCQNSRKIPFFCAEPSKRRKLMLTDNKKMTIQGLGIFSSCYFPSQLLCHPGV